MARPRKHVDVREVVRLRELGQSWPKIARAMRLGLGTVFRAHREACRSSQPFQNGVKAKLEADGETGLKAEFGMEERSSTQDTAG